MISIIKTKEDIVNLYVELANLPFGVRHIHILNKQVDFIKYPVTLPSEHGHGFHLDEVKTFGIMTLDGSKQRTVPHFTIVLAMK